MSRVRINRVTILLYTDPNGDGDPSDGVLVQSNLTDAAGSYNLPGLTAGTYVVEELDPVGFDSTADAANAPGAFSLPEYRPPELSADRTSPEVEKRSAFSETFGQS